MAVLTIDETKPTALFYLDSGPLPSSDTYTTIFILHGHTFHSPVFSRLLALAPTYNLRLVAITRRDYPGSTPFTDEELRVIQGGNKDEKLTFLKDRALEIWKFVRRFAKERELPKWRQEDGKGGIFLMGWSLGNMLGLAAMTFLKEMPQDLREDLNEWVKGYIIFGEQFSHDLYRTLTQTT
ncbi:hypothetical protein M422DRAFT_71509 [Sphaerobolus stellatus SS14]|uniref:AB hydrolase-1 domain-containing protein n=1 Tax=Sphaerobolus stellatus (strain SS14) TaxID=990650 RepID=A0A0C9TF21_SPHS4|nr:hypothetical protein M422DRAFT_71509 [Sphaerobolus stellatus SS14]